ncbi:protein kinase (macronuclear) [Tetrahymena thermophila SB210]|uniref:Protein kinase n=1 Tax=Tetrahymena thermophila (strain SB210) TaxID=312017 RepID=Q240V9_TETTS|nr:protein kinase [Tetrahymena thermophila SB210]EAS02305.4 protein kinase [Tetrahymena thermophila SB210]|eukprot:XP_001022550.4 protein kinase [Tetrahymena thermophila SB210]
MAELNQIPEITEISINDIFDIYSTGDTVITKSLGYGSLGPVFQASQKCDDVCQNIVIKSFSCTQTLYDQIANQVNQTKVFQNSQNVLKFQIKKVAENGDHVATAFEMELCQKSLQQYIAEIKEGKANPTKSEVLVYFIQALNGLLELQENGYQHHNLKSSNILISEDDTIKISDSSFTLELSQKIYNKPQQYNRFLSINYLSPEYTSLIDGKGQVEISNSSDVFSLGVIFLELIGQEINIVSAIKLKSGIFEGVQVKEGFQDLASFICENMLCYLPQDRKTITWLIEAFSEQFFNEVTKFSILDDKTLNTDQALEKEKEEDQMQNTEEVEKQNVLVQCDNEAKNESLNESQNISSPLKNSFNENEYEILENDQEAEIVNNHQASAKKQDQNEHESQESTLDQEAIQAQNQNQENEVQNQIEEENTVSSQQGVESTNQVNETNNSNNVQEIQNQEAEQIPLINLDDSAIKKQISRIQRLRIDLNSKNLGNQQNVTLFQKLEAFTSLTHLTLDLSNNQIEDDKINELSQFLSKCNNLIDLTLKLENNKLTPLSLTVLNNALSRLNNMTRFQLSIGSQLLSESIEKTWEIETISLINIMKSWNSLAQLNISLGQLKVSNMLISTLVSYLTDFPSLKELVLQFGFQSDVTEEVWNKFVQFVQDQENLSKSTLPIYENKQENVEEDVENSVNQGDTARLISQEIQVEQNCLATEPEMESNLQIEQLNAQQETKTEEEQVEQQIVDTEAQCAEQYLKQEQLDDEQEETVTQQTQSQAEQSNQVDLQQTQEVSTEEEELSNLNTEEKQNKEELTQESQQEQLKQVEEEQIKEEEVQETTVSQQNEIHDNQDEQNQKQEQLNEEIEIQNEINESKELQNSDQKDTTEQNNLVEEEVQEKSDNAVSE